MTKKTSILIVALIIAISCCSFALFSCGEQKIVPREVILELINPNTGEVMEGGERIDLPKEETHVEVRIKDKETGVYLTDDDLPENTIKNSYTVGFYISETNVAIYTYGYWPTEVDYYYDYYEIAIRFDCRPKNLSEPGKFQRKYKDTDKYIRFYINRKQS